MANRLITTGVDRLLTSLSDGEKLKPNTAEQRYVTYVNDVGAVHTIIVEVEHVVNDAHDILEWFDHTRTAVEHLFEPNLPGDRTNADAVLLHAAAQMRPPTVQAVTQQVGGGS